MTPAEVFQKAASLHQAGKLDEAAGLYDQLLAQFPGHADTLHMRGVVDLQKGLFAEALAFFDRALGAAPRHAAALTNRAAACLALGRMEDALASCDRALAIDPKLASACNNRGHALAHLARVDEAFDAYGRALALRPDYLDALSARALLLYDRGRYDAALADCEKLLALQPRHADILALRGRAKRALGRSEDALADLEAALALRPDMSLLPGEIAYLSLQLCAWQGLASKIEAVLAAIDADRLAAEPLMVTALPSTGAQQLKAAATFFAKNAPPPLPVHNPTAGEKLRIGYFSSDFHDHAVAHLMLGVLEAHNRAEFEIVAYASGGEPSSAMRARIAAAMDDFIDISAMTDEDVVARCRAADLQVAIDLNGYTGGVRTGIFALGAAPVQVNFLGYPGTLGTDRYQYIIADAVVAPPEHNADFAEHIVAMPHTYLVNNDIKRHFIARTFTRAELGLPETGFVFCCFNAAFKITPDAFDIWMRLLKAVEGSVLWLSEDGGSVAARNLRREAEARGVPADRIVFSKRTPGPEYLARFRAADLFLDTFYYNAHATASDALLVGLPVLTRIGTTFASRVGASLLTTAGLPDLIAPDSAAYEKTALHLATHPEELARLRARLGQASGLFDARRFARNLETAYRAMWDRHARGLAPDRITVAET